MSDVKILTNTLIAVGEEVSGATVAILSDEAGGRRFAFFGLDDEGAFLDAEDGQRFYLVDADRVVAEMASEQNVVVVYAIGADEQVHQYPVKVVQEHSNGPGGP